MCSKAATVSMRGLRYILLMMLLSCGAFSHAQADQPTSHNEPTDFFNLDLAVDDSDARDELSPDASPWSLYGSIKMQSQYTTQNQLSEFAYRREKNELSQARVTVRLNALGQLFGRVNVDISGIAFYDELYHNDLEGVSEEEFDALADELALRSAHIQFEVRDNLWLKFGQQVIAFGESDFIQIVDVVNPRDERELGLVDLEDARLPIMATRLSYVGQRWGIDVVLTHEFDSNRDAGEGADFDRYISVRNQLTIDQAREPTVDFTNPGKLLRGFWSHAHGDISVVLAKMVDQTPVLALSPLGGTVVDEVYPEVTTYGIAASWVEGFWLLKSEVAKKENAFIPLSDSAQQLSLGFGEGELFVEKDIVQTLVGIEYSGYQDIQLAAELTTTTILDYESALFPEEHESVLTSLVVFEFYRDTVDLEVLWAHWLDNDSDSVRVTYSYDYSDEVQLSLGYIDFLSNEKSGVLYPYRNNDRIFGSISYSF